MWVKVTLEFFVLFLQLFCESAMIRKTKQNEADKISVLHSGHEL